MKLRTATRSQVLDLKDAAVFLESAIFYAKRGGAVRALNRLRGCRKSLQGAISHASRCRQANETEAILA